MMFSQPDRVIAAAVHDFDALKGALINCREGYAALRPTEELQDSKFHFSAVHHSPGYGRKSSASP
jgi:hypothetical protein